MKQKIYQVDAFTDKIFGGNPAAVCPLNEWLPDALMQQIALENNLAETAFFVKNGGQFDIRWFTPSVEVDLCGHATLATAFVLFHHEGYADHTITFYSHRSGLLSVSRQADLLSLNFPADTLEPVNAADIDVACFGGLRPLKAYKGKTDYLFVFETEQDIINMQPGLQEIAKLPARGVIVTARGTREDFVSRFFAPQSGINEDPVTGSAHTSLVPYWAGILHKDVFTAAQLSARRGDLQCRLLGDRVEISGQCVLYMSGVIDV